MKTNTLILFLCFAVYAKSQSFQVDTTFQPFFDIRDQRGAQINEAYENTSDGFIYILGNFDEYFGQIPHEGSTCYYRDGSLVQSYSSGSGSGNLNTLQKAKQSIYYRGFDANGSLIDSLGNTVNIEWRGNFRKTVTCATGLPYFFPDGSSLFANGRDNSGDPCDIGLPDSTNPGSHILKLTPDGLWDSTFSVSSNRNPRGFFRYDSNRIIVYGNPRDFMTYNGVQIDGMCRIYLDGRLDTSFHSPLQGVNASSEAIPDLVQEDGSFLIRGRFILKEDPNYQTLAKLNADGSLDTTFMNFSGATDSIYFASIDAVATVEDGGYIVGGRFDSYQGAKKNCLAKLDSSGKLQAQFFTSYGPDSAYAGVIIRPQINVIEKSRFGGYYVGGWFTTWDGKPVQPIVRLTGLDSLDLVDTNTSVHEIKSIENQVNIYPNPANESVTIQAAEQAEIVEIQLFSLHGKTVPIDVLKATNSLVSIQLSTLKSGIYIIQVKLHNGLTLRKKLVKH